MIDAAAPERRKRSLSLFHLLSEINFSQAAQCDGKRVPQRA
jgi:hypothetical protein